ncbi:hypothetical protein ES703_45719 [subsurface metagenome]
MNLRYWLNVNTGEVIDTYYESLTDFRRRTQNWCDVLVTISFEVFSKLTEKEAIRLPALSAGLKHRAVTSRETRRPRTGAEQAVGE